MAIVFDTGGVAPAERADAITAAMQEASAPCNVVHENLDGSAHARFAVWEFGDVNIFRADMSGIQLIRTPKQIRTSPSPLLAIAVHRRSAARYEQNGHQHELAVGDLHMMDLNAPYDFRWMGAGGSTCLHVPLDQLDLPIERIRRAAPHLSRSPFYRLVAGHITEMTRQADRLSADPTARLTGSASVDLIRGLLLSTSEPEYRDGAVIPSQIMLAEIRGYVRRNLADPDLDAARIARALNISVRLLYKTCAAADYSLAQWIISQRLDRIRDDLTRPHLRHQSIAVIALRWGFRDPSHFARRFRATYGVTPREWRRTTTEDGGHAAPRA
ncbi:helix-turn-helix domain-containing protein [Nocardia alba]|uniref:AraC-like DNA-binding protein n=1 Tax=Nocardia alba TaxID=225051 RepID=A0A4R1FN55_9NOCA|nr:helix-turn-helix domain-containing protein [Nocardia alba]TCJ96436.1 AraC-like DNA-binding protein [Nocardia alba]